MIKIEIKIDGNPSIISYNANKGDFINKEIISDIIQNYKNSLKEKKIKFIRYLNPKYDAWMLLNEKEDLEIKNDMQILVKLKDNNLNEKQIIKKNEIIRKIKNLYKAIDQEVSKLDKQKDIKDFRPSKTYNKTIKDEEKNDKEIVNDNSFYSGDDDKDFADIIVLTSNPLLDNCQEDYQIEEKKELRSMNDFNSITDSIHNYILNDCNKQIKVSFLPLTENNLQKSIFQKPKIIHLICKSIYQLEKNNDNNNNLNNKYCVNLLFENENCQVERKNENDLKTIFASLKKEILKNINLFISTPLSEDVFDMVKNLNFKNIIVQHTSLANVEFISELNKQLYKNIIDLNYSIKNSLNNAKKDSMNIDKMKDKQQSCCCFHKHEDNCKFKMNLYNELYSDNINKEEIFKIPHFYHLRYKCECKEKDFCTHKKKNLCDNYHYSFNSISKKNKSQHICCCHSLKKIHDLDHIFFCKFNEEEIFSNYKSNIISLVIDQEFVPNYGKMNLILGRNLIVYNIFDFIKNNTKKIINIFGKQYLEDINKIDLFIDMIKEFLKERIPYLIYDDFHQNLNNEDNSHDLLLVKKKTSIIKKNKYQFFKDKMNTSSSKLLNLNLNLAISAPQGLGQVKNIPKFEKIYFKTDKENNIYIINDIKNCQNKVYFINGFKIKNIDLIKIFEQKELFQSHIILFTENKFEKNNIKNSNDIEISYLPFQSLNKNDYEIKLQNQKISSTKFIFDKIIKNKLIESNYIEKENNLEDNLSESSTINKEKNNNNLNYEILFLFNCSNSGYFLMEMKALFPNNLEEIKSIIEKKYIPKSVLLKIEGANYYRYIINESVFKYYYEIREDLIPNKVKQLLLEKLFRFYSFAFRLILREAKVREWEKIDNDINVELKKNSNIKKKYKPYDYLTTFSAIQELGIWLPFGKNKNNEQTISLDIHNLYGYFNHLLRNFKDMFKEKNIMLCMKNKEIWKNIEEDIADISITSSTLLKMFLLNDQKLIITFNNIFKKEENNIKPASLRFFLFDNMSNEYYQHKKKHLQELEKIEFGFQNIGYVEGELETLFAKCIVNFTENGDLKKFNDIFKNKIMTKLFDLKNNKADNIDEKDKDKFITLFQSKVKYKYIKYKLKKGKKISKLLLNNEDIADLKELLINFKEKKNFFYMLKTSFLLSEWHFQKYQYGKKNGKEENK